MTKLLPLFVALFFIGCTDDYTYVNVSITNLWPEVHSLKVSATVNGTAAKMPREITTNLQVFSVALPGGKVWSRRALRGGEDLHGGDLHLTSSRLRAGHGRPGVRRPPQAS